MTRNVRLVPGLHEHSVSTTMQNDPLYKEVRDKHATFHKEAGQVLNHALNNDAASASRLLNGGVRRALARACVAIDQVEIHTADAQRRIEL